MKFTIRHRKVILLITIENKHRRRVGAAPGKRLANHAVICLIDHAIDERHKHITIRTYIGAK